MASTAELLERFSKKPIMQQACHAKLPMSVTNRHRMSSKKASVPTERQTLSSQHKAGVGNGVVLGVRGGIRFHGAGIAPIIRDAVQAGRVLHIVDAADVLLLHGDGQAFHRVLKLRYFAFGASQPLFQYALVVGNRLHSFGKSRHIAVQPIHILLEIGCFFCKFIGRNIGSKHDFAALQVPPGRAVLRLDDTCLDDVC